MEDKDQIYIMTLQVDLSTLKSDIFRPCAGKIHELSMQKAIGLRLKSVIHLYHKENFVYEKASERKQI